MSDLMILCGPYAAGKTTLGKKLAKAFKRPFFDSDEFLDQGQGAQALHRELGEEAFREREYEAIKLLLTQSQAIIATGGGSVVSPHTRALLKQALCVIYLRVEKEELWTRWQSRGFPHFAHTRVDFERYLNFRLSLYEGVADRVVCANHLETAFKELCG